LIEQALKNFKTTYPHSARQIAKGLEELYSGFVHGAYAWIMELYDPYAGAFAMDGMHGRIEEWMGCVSLNLHHSLNSFSSIAHALRLGAVKKAVNGKATGVRKLTRLY
jgi:hypothetical protein